MKADTFTVVLTCPVRSGPKTVARNSGNHGRARPAMRTTSGREDLHWRGTMGFEGMTPESHALDQSGELQQRVAIMRCSGHRCCDSDCENRPKRSRITTKLTTQRPPERSSGGRVSFRLFRTLIGGRGSTSHSCELIQQQQRDRSNNDCAVLRARQPMREFVPEVRARLGV